MNSTSDSPSSKPGGCSRGCLIGALAPLALIGLIVLGIMGRSAWYRWQKAQGEKKAQAERLARYEAMLGKLTPDQKEEPKYDLDKTIRVIHSIDLAMKEQTSFEDFVSYIMKTDVRDVAPEVLEARKEILAVLKPLYAKQQELEARQNLWAYSSEFLLTTLSLFEVSISPLDFQIGADKEQAKAVLEELETREAMDAQKREEISKLEDKLFEAVYDYSETYFKYLREWDRLCAYRDRAYLALAERNWKAAEENALAAMQMAPTEKEAHLTYAMALIEQGGEMNLSKAGGVLDTYSQAHPDSTAPALLLNGVISKQKGNLAEARLHFEHAASYYPRQATSLSDMLDPYKHRAYLRKSREGNLILQNYQAMMLGAGYYSPDLQLANMFFQQDNPQDAESKVFDHFFRRRNQGNMAFILSDIDFCYGFLGTPFYQIYPESSYLDLEVSPGLFSNKLSVKVHNRSDQTLHNASLILCLHMTDMMQGDYLALQVNETLPAVMANDVTDFKSLEIEFELNGKEKSVKDIVATRAILISQEAVVWVDTEEYRIAEAKEFRDLRKRGEDVPELNLGWLQKLEQNPNETIQKLFRNVKIKPKENRWGTDGVEVTLPKDLAILKPIFKLMVDGEELSPGENKIDADDIRLVFDKVLEHSDPEQRKKLEKVELIINSPFTDMALEMLQKEEDKDSYQIKPSPR